MKLLIPLMAILFFANCASERSSPTAPNPTMLVTHQLESVAENTIQCQQALDRFVETSSLTENEKWIYSFFVQNKDNPFSYEDTLQYLLEIHGLEYLEPGITYDSSLAATEQYYYLVWLTRQIMANRPPYGNGEHYPDANYLTVQLIELIEERSNWVPLPPGTHAIEVDPSHNNLLSRHEHTLDAARQRISEAVMEVCSKPYLKRYSNYRVMWLLSYRDEMLSAVPAYFGDMPFLENGPEDGCAACHNSVARARATSQFVAGTVTGVIVGAATGGNPFIGGAAAVAAWSLMDEVNNFVFNEGEYCNPNAEEEGGEGTNSFMDNPWLGGVYCDGFYCSPPVP